MNDKVEKLAEIVVDHLNALEASCVNARRQIGELFNVAASAKEPQKDSPAVVKEDTFIPLKFEPQEGQKIGAYDVAYKASNIEEKWVHAFDILRQSNATIKARYHGEGYVFSYWLYGENKIYRQKLKNQA